MIRLIKILSTCNEFHFLVANGLDIAVTGLKLATSFVTVLMGGKVLQQ